MLANNKPRYYEQSIPSTLAMVAPATRLAFVAAWAWFDGEGALKSSHEICPVVALAASQRFSYTRHADGGPERPAPTHKGMEERGWSFDGYAGEVRFDLVILTRDSGVTSAADFQEFEDIIPSACDVVACPWPFEADEERLAETCLRLEKNAQERLTRGAPR